MELEGDRIAVVESGIRSELAARDHPSVRGQCDDLILVRSRVCHGPIISIHPVAPRLPLVAMETYSPPFRRLDDGAAERLGHCLMTKANADQFRPATGISKKSHELVDPRQSVINSGAGAGDQVSLASGD